MAGSHTGCHGITAGTRGRVNFPSTPGLMMVGVGGNRAGIRWGQMEMEAPAASHPCEKNHLHLEPNQKNSESKTYPGTELLCFQYDVYQRAGARTSFQNNFQQPKGIICF